jgi:hypothetical protein
MSLFSLLCLLWLYRYMQKRKFGGGKMFLILFSTLIMGIVVPLLYLPFREKPIA